MRRFLLLLFMVLVLSGCVTTGTSGRSCVTLTVDNQNYYDVVVMNDQGNRVGRFEGFRRSTRRLCSLNGRPERFGLRSFTSAWPPLSLQGVRSYLEPTDSVHITVTPNPRQSIIRH